MTTIYNMPKITEIVVDRIVLHFLFCLFFLWKSLTEGATPPDFIISTLLDMM